MATGIPLLLIFNRRLLDNQGTTNPARKFDLSQLERHQERAPSLALLEHHEGQRDGKEGSQRGIDR
jgi:hypothetical protein